jgi:hypothetical protein
MLFKIIDFLALVLSGVFVYLAFNPKYRYNDHLKWEPDIYEHLIIWGFILIIWVAILK